jgi:hypothetical protein
MPSFAGTPAIRKVPHAASQKPFPHPAATRAGPSSNLYDSDRRRTVTLGAWGSAEAEQKFARLVAERQVHWRRTSVNHRIDRVKRVFKWAAAAELVPVTTYQALRALAGLRRGRTGARESKPVGPVDPAHVAATLPFLTPHPRCMVELQRRRSSR